MIEFRADFGVEDAVRLAPCKDDKPKDAEIMLFQAGSDYSLSAKYTLTEQDILQARTFEDYVVKGAFFNFDVHNISGAGLDRTGIQKHFAQNMGYTIPYGCLIPESKRRLLLCGRNISGTHIAHSNFRAMPICVGIGEAAGAAAFVAVNKRCDLTDVQAAEIREIIGV